MCVVLSMFQAKIIDSNGHLLPINTAGEICFRGYNVMLGYWEDKDKTDACIDASGWFYSGYVFLDLLPLINYVRQICITQLDFLFCYSCQGIWQLWTKMDSLKS